MSNIIKMEEQQAIIGLKAQGWSDRKIARELVLNRRTVKRYVLVLYHRMRQFENIEMLLETSYPQSCNRVARSAALNGPVDSKRPALMIAACERFVLKQMGRFSRLAHYPVCKKSYSANKSNKQPQELDTKLKLLHCVIHLLCHVR